MGNEYVWICSSLYARGHICNNICAALFFNGRCIKIEAVVWCFLPFWLPQWSSHLILLCILFLWSSSDHQKKVDIFTSPLQFMCVHLSPVFTLTPFNTLCPPTTLYVLGLGPIHPSDRSSWVPSTSALLSEIPVWPHPSGCSWPCTSSTADLLSQRRSLSDHLWTSPSPTSWHLASVAHTRSVLPFIWLPLLFPIKRWSPSCHCFDLENGYQHTSPVLMSDLID